MLFLWQYLFDIEPNRTRLDYYYVAAILSNLFFIILFGLFYFIFYFDLFMELSLIQETG